MTHVEVLNLVAPFPTINWLAVVVAAVVNFVIGGIYYAPPVLGNRWMNLLGKKKEELGMRGPSLAGGFVVGLIQAAILAIIVGYAAAKNPVDGALIGFWVWLGFIATIGAGQALFEKRPMNLYALNVVYELIAFLVMGAIIGAFG